MTAEPRDSAMTLSELKNFSLENLLRRVAVARRRGDVSPAQPAWNAAVIRTTPRVRATVRAYRTINGDRIAAHDVDAVVNEALERAMRCMIRTLDQLDPNSFGAAMVTCAENTCKDHFRRLGQHAKGIAGSLDDRAFDDGEAGRFDAEVARASELQMADDQSAFEAADRLSRAMAQMKNEARRQAVQLRESGLEYEEIAKTLDTTVGNAYQLYCRGLRDLYGLMEP